MATLQASKELRDCVESFWPNRSSDAKTESGNYIIKKGKKVSEAFRLIENGGISEKGIRKCIERATIDITTRTMKSTHSPKPNWMFCFAKAIADEGKLYENIVAWFDQSTSDISAASFDEWHHKACESALSVIRANYTNRDDSEVNYGKAQKVVNMTMKTVYCLLLSETEEVQSRYEPYFAYCHMPLDSIILDGWFDKANKDAFVSEGEKYDAKKRSGWSYINYSENTYDENQKYAYSCLVEQIRSLLAQKTSEYSGYTALQAEFLIWPKYREKSGIYK